MIKKETFSVNTVKQENYELRTEVHQGKEHIVIPVIMMVEGVHSGSHGPLLHTIEELGKYPGSWDGIPVVIDHPQVDGESVSANSPIIIDTRTVGRVYNTYVDGIKLKAEAWIDIQKINNISPETLVSLRATEIIEVSVGVFTDDEDVPGDWNGENYTAIAHNHRPDHLALLPGGTGACSVNDGCGTRSYSKKGGLQMKDDLIKVMKESKDKGFVINEIIDNLSEGLSERLNLLRSKIDSLDTNDSVHYLLEAYDDFVVFEAKLRVGGSKMYKQNYQINNGGVELSGDAVEVQRKVEYVNINRSSYVRGTQKKEVKVDTNEKKPTPCVVSKVNALIANTLTSYTEEDREWLQTLELPQLEKMEVKAPTKPIESNVQVLSDEQKADLAWAKAERLAKRNSMIGVIQANTSKEIWPDATLAAMNQDTLERIFDSVKTKETDVDYSMNNNMFVSQGNGGFDVDPLYPTGVEMDVK